MKKSIILITFLTLIASAKAQICLTFEEVDSAGISFTEFDSLYVKAFVMDTTVQSAFKGREKDFLSEYYSLTQEFTTFLNQNEFYWNNTTKTFSKMYFSKDGKMEYWFLKIKDPEMSEERTKQLKNLAVQFMKKRHIQLPTSQSFQQCGSVTFRDNE
jgi:hypothetical protein